jgi:hypothetical protein
MNIVDNIVGRLHVMTPDREVIRAIREGLRPECRKDPALREARKECYREGLKRHAENRRLYVAVMTGRL